MSNLHDPYIAGRRVAAVFNRHSPHGALGDSLSELEARRHFPYIRGRASSGSTDRDVSGTDWGDFKVLGSAFEEADCDTWGSNFASNVDDATAAVAQEVKRAEKHRYKKHHRMIMQRRAELICGASGRIKVARFGAVIVPEVKAWMKADLDGKARYLFSPFGQIIIGDFLNW